LLLAQSLSSRHLRWALGLKRVAEGRADRLVDLVDEALVVVVFLAEL